MSTSAEELEWRERYRQLSEQQEQQAREHAQAEAVLGRTIVRLCVAASGLDPALDPHLKRLREAVKEGYSPRLERQVNGLMDALVHAGEQTQGPDPLERLLARLQLPRGQLRRATRLWEELARAPAGAAEAQLDELVGLLGLQAPGPVSEQGGGLLSRLFGRGEEAPAEAASAPNRTLAGLLARIEWPEMVRGEIEALRTQLDGEAEPDAWLGVVERISGLVVGVFEDARREIESAESFLGELSTRLEAIDRHMSGEVARRAVADENDRRLRRAVHAEVGGISESMRQSQDLPALRRAMLESLDRIQGHVVRHLDLESQQRNAAGERERVLREDLNRLEQETFDLRQEIAQSRQLAMRDALTGLPNRRAYDERTLQEFARSRRFATPLVLVVWDVDNFKQLNDRFGHKAGDKALRLIGGALRKRLRETDFIARYGGEEFVVLMPGTTAEDALRVAGEMRAEVKGVGLHFNNEPITVTVSGGLAQLAEGDTPEGLFERADQGLYRAKAAGKDQVVSA